MNRILIIEDDDILRKNIAFALEEAGYSAQMSANLTESEKMISDSDLILLDVILPDGNGMDFCRNIHEKYGTPIIFITSCDDEADVVNGFDCGADDYIRKPFRLNELLSRVKAVLRRSAAFYDGPELTAVEQKLLEYLMQNKERFLTREQILEYLWDSKNCFVNDNTLSVNISRLRDKLKSSSCGQIVTKRGLGYKWTQQTNS
ncbi:MAG: response regulator transcription factor [Oscillospiraceae bacterium]|nr:response regulator transcription factor [Oscillospiraceae bacterium]